MDQYKHIFYEDFLKKTMFIKIITTTEHSDLETFKTKDPDKYDIWSKHAVNKYEETNDGIYLDKACFYAEQSKIVGFGYGLVGDSEENTIEFIYDGDNEETLIRRIFMIINELTRNIDAPLLCGHNISGYDIPFLIKRALKYNVPVPDIFKKSLMTKPWESFVLDTVNLWKFGGNDYTSLECIVSHLDLKYKSLPLSLNEVNRKFYSEPDMNKRIKK